MPDPFASIFLLVRSINLSEILFLIIDQLQKILGSI